MNEEMDATVMGHRHEERTNLLLRHCLQFDEAERRRPALERLDEAIGRDLARRLVRSLTARSARF